MEELTDSKHKNQGKKIYVKESSPPSIEDLLANPQENETAETKDGLLRIKPIKFETKTHKTLKNAREKAAEKALHSKEATLSNQINYKRLLILISVMGLAGLLAVWFINGNKTTSNQNALPAKELESNKDTITKLNSAKFASTNNLFQDAILQAAIDSSDAHLENLEESDKFDKDAEPLSSSASDSNAEYREQWSATYQSLESLYTTEERSLVMLPAWLIGASQEQRCFGEATKNCLPKNVLKVNKRYCIETKFSNRSSDVEISEVVGYFGNATDKSIKTLSFDQYTSTRHRIKSLGVKSGVSWRLVKCPF